MSEKEMLATLKSACAKLKAAFEGGPVKDDLSPADDVAFTIQEAGALYRIVQLKSPGLFED